MIAFTMLWAYLVQSKTKDTKSSVKIEKCSYHSFEMKKKEKKKKKKEEKKALTNEERTGKKRQRKENTNSLLKRSYNRQ